jgi:hypothetical protein
MSKMGFFKGALAAAAMTVAAGAADAATYTYVGSWSLGSDGTVWTDNPAVFSGQEAAAFLFGGTADDYVISTVSSLVSDINFSAWLDGWADSYTYAGSLAPAAQDFSLDSTGLGYNGCSIAATECYQSAYSALVLDHFYGYGGPNNDTFVNYAFKVSEVPLPAGGALLLMGMGGLALVRRRKDAI